MTARAQTRRSTLRLRRSWLLWAALVAAVSGYAIGRWRRPAAPAAPDAAAPFRGEDAGPASSEANRIDALTKLKGLRDEGVLTQEQYESERERLTQGIG